MTDFDMRPFHCERFYDQLELLGGHWWQVRLQEQLQQAAAGSGAPSRRALLALVAGATGVAVLGGTALLFRGSGDSTVPSVDLQRTDGFDVGARGQTLVVPNASRLDAAGDAIRLERLASLVEDLAPAQVEWRPFYVPTLFQALATDARLRAVITGMDAPSMRQAQRRAEVLRAILGAGVTTGVGLVVDLPGPQAVAFAAGLLPDFDPVFVFDNWPHPHGVVPAHLTLAAALFLRPTFMAAPRAATARAPVFVLDRERLAPYGNEPDRFDNRYAAHLPAASDLRGRGVERLLCVVADGATRQEADDLNDTFVGYREAGVDVKLLGLTDLDPDPAPAPDPTPNAAAPAAGRGYGAWNHGWFFHHYGWGPLPLGGYEPRRGAGVAYQPLARATRFGAPGAMAAKFAGLGRVAKAPASGSRSRSTTRWFGS